jgi:transposase
MLSVLNERQSRIYLGVEAENLGWGGISKVHQLSGVNRRTIAAGVKEIGQEVSELEKNRIRKKGGGRKKEVEKQPQIMLKIKEIILPHTMGDPEKPLIPRTSYTVQVWCSKSVRKIQKTLRDEGYQISHESIRKYLKMLGFSLQSNTCTAYKVRGKKTKEGGDHPDRDAQFEHINTTAKDFLSAGDPVISVDCKKKELIGEFKNNGREWTLVEHPEEVGVYDFIDKTNACTGRSTRGKAAPYGVYDIGNNRGWISVGISSDTAAFAVSTIQSWWEGEGKDLYPTSKRLYTCTMYKVRSINADGGGSNGSRNKLWKEELQKFANQHDLEIHVSHFPPGTSKWNKIEHRLFSQISLNWRAKPLTSIPRTSHTVQVLVILNLIGATTTETGLVVKAVLDEKQYQTGIKITDDQIKEWNTCTVYEVRGIEKNEFQEKWNYIIKPNLK